MFVFVAATLYEQKLFLISECAYRHNGSGPVYMNGIYKMHILYYTCHI